MWIKQKSHQDRKNRCKTEQKFKVHKLWEDSINDLHKRRHANVTWPNTMKRRYQC